MAWKMRKTIESADMAASFQAIVRGRRGEARVRRTVVNQGIIHSLFREYLEQTELQLSEADRVVQDVASSPRRAGVAQGCNIPAMSRLMGLLCSPGCTVYRTRCSAAVTVWPCNDSTLVRLRGGNVGKTHAWRVM